MSATDYVQAFETLRRQDFEQQVVCKTLRAGGVVGQLDEFVVEHDRLYGTPFLSLDWFHDRFPAFPARLGAVFFKAEPPAWTDLFQSFTKTPMFAAYRTWRRDNDVDDRTQPAGLVFNMDGVTFVLHTCRAAVDRPGKRFVRLLGSPPTAFAFEEFSTFLECVGDAWAASPSPTRSEE